MGSVAVSRLAVDEDTDLAPVSIVDQVAAMARKELAPLAAAIDSGLKPAHGVAGCPGMSSPIVNARAASRMSFSL